VLGGGGGGDVAAAAAAAAAATAAAAQATCPGAGTTASPPAGAMAVSGQHAEGLGQVPEQQPVAQRQAVGANDGSAELATAASAAALASVGAPAPLQVGCCMGLPAVTGYALRRLNSLQCIALPCASIGTVLYALS
jgi:hypothetical protein